MENTKILFFDDDKYLGDIFQKSLKDIYKYDVAFFSEIPKFFDAIKSNVQYDLFLLDIMVPLIDGSGRSILDQNFFSEDDISEIKQGLNTGEILFKKIRNIEKYKQTPVLFYSAKKSLDTIEKDDYTDFIQKPVLVRDVDKKIKEMLKK